jgi:hypothetical protein
VTAAYKLLVRLVRDALLTGDDKIIPVGNPITYEKLRSLGWVATSDDSVGDRLTAKALEEVFDTFEEIPCPSEVQVRVEELGLSGVRWRRAERFINQNQAQPLVCTIFIKNPTTAQLSSWFHELAARV